MLGDAVRSRLDRVNQIARESRAVEDRETDRRHRFWLAQQTFNAAQLEAVTAAYDDVRGFPAALERLQAALDALRAVGGDNA